jgi:hypothetical protein
MSDEFVDADLDNLVAELDQSNDAEHPDVSVTHDSGWALSAFPSGLVVWERVDSDDLVVHRPWVDRTEVRRLFGLLARDDVDAVASFGWEPGYGR